MKKKLLVITVSVLMTLTTFAGCGDKKEITTDTQENTSAQANQEAVTDSEAQTQNTEVSSVSTGSNGYEFSYKNVTMYPDMDVAAIVSTLGDPLNYFEAASCAFEGLDKIYTYASFEIDTYPSGDKDLISAVILKDDLVITEEGAYIGMNTEQITKIYGEQSVQNGMLVYTEGDMKLKFIFDGDTVVSIEYDSKVLDLE